MLNLCLAYFLNNCNYLNEFDSTQLKLEVLLGKKTSRIREVFNQQALKSKSLSTLGLVINYNLNF